MELIWILLLLIVTLGGLFFLICALGFGKTAFACCVRRRRQPEPEPAPALALAPASDHSSGSLRRPPHHPDSICSSSHMAALSPNLDPTRRLMSTEPAAGDVTAGSVDAH